ncbi:CDP-glucose 4,6-dehydratase [Synechococcus sp. CB0101]|uniref:CDP-glucose 4,6-dehydratase n=1 Tax=Synechococcus sp. CB0101 TaxID=232348 RepID=UPI0008FEEC32|nr:CDP-glucose 4,6-dehydratase [Synechococcus sp. CB0101]
MNSVSPDFWYKKKVLVTGHTGFKGSWLSIWLDLLGADVYGLSLDPLTKPNLFDELSTQPLFIDSFICDILNYDSIQSIVEKVKPDIVFHLAAQPLVRESFIDPVGTWNVNVIGTMNIIKACLTNDIGKCSLVLITTDKVYKNNEWSFGYRENDALGGIDPYSSSKAAAEICIASMRKSFCGNLDYQFSNKFLTSVRSGNVIGGGDWSTDRIIPDIVRALHEQKEVIVRNPLSTRPWLHVLEPLRGYLLLAQKQHSESVSLNAMNFGPNVTSNRSVNDLVMEALKNWNGSYKSVHNSGAYHEASNLHLQSDYAFHCLGWTSLLTFEDTIRLTIDWYKKYYSGQSAAECCISDLEYYTSLFN